MLSSRIGAQREKIDFMIMQLFDILTEIEIIIEMF